MGPNLAAEVGRRLGQQKWRRGCGWEWYGLNGEIEECREGPLGPAGDEKDGRVDFIAICHTGSPRPRCDWRERGVIPPRGWYFPEDRELDALGRKRPRYGGENPLRGQTDGQ